MSFSSEEIAKIHVVISDGGLSDFSEKVKDAAVVNCFQTCYL